MTLSGKTIFITGASRGIGRAIALRCARDGANIIIAAKTGEPNPKLPGTIHSVAEEVEAAGGHALPIVLDVRDEVRIGYAIGDSVQRFGGIDAVINNAGAISLTSTANTPMKKFDLMVGVNVRATFAASQAALPFLQKSSNPHILNISPPIDLNPRWLNGHVAYTISKYGTTMCTIGMAAELASAGIAVNSLWPRSIIDTVALRLLGGDSLTKASRTGEIMADAAYAILTTPSRELTGQCFLDETFLRSRGVTDFDKYAISPGTPLIPDLYVSDMN